MTSIVWIRTAVEVIGRTSPNPTPEIVITTMNRASNERPAVGDVAEDPEDDHQPHRPEARRDPADRRTVPALEVAVRDRLGLARGPVIGSTGLPRCDGGMAARPGWGSARMAEGDDRGNGSIRKPAIVRAWAGGTG